MHKTEQRETEARICREARPGRSHALWPWDSGPLLGPSVPGLLRNISGDDGEGAGQKNQAGKQWAGTVNEKII